MKKIPTCCLAIPALALLISLLPPELVGQSYTNGQPYIRTDIPTKPDTFPIPMSFRAFDPLAVVADDYSDVGRSTPYDFNTEQLPAQAWMQVIHAITDNSTKQSDILNANPSKIVTLQKAWGGVGKGLISGDPSAGTGRKVWPGHVLYKAPAKLTPGGINTGNNATTTVYAVDDANLLFSGNQTTLNEANGWPNGIITSNPADQDPNTLGIYLTIYEADKTTGIPNWNRAEYVKLVGKATDNKTITVVRGQLGTTAQANYNVTYKEIRVAAPMKFWTNQWQLNFSFECPKDANGETAAVWYAKEVQDAVYQSGADGVEHDVARWTWGTPESNPMDCNNNGKVDYGFIDGINSFGLGGQAYLAKLRELLPNHIIQMDSTNPATGQRGYKYPNGIQMESFPNANMFSQFATAFQHLRSWHNFGEQPTNLSYPFTKTSTTVFANVYDPDAQGNLTLKTDWHFRVGLASSVLLKMAHPFASLTSTEFDPDNPLDVGTDASTEEVFGTFNWDEYHGGDLNNYTGWLGKTTGTLGQDFSDIDFSSGTAGLIPPSQWAWSVDTSAGYVATTSKVTANGTTTYTANVTTTPAETSSETAQARYMRVKLAPTTATTLAAGQYYTLQFGAQGQDSWNITRDGVTTTWSSVPRFISIRGIDPEYDTSPTGVLVGSGTTTDPFYSFNISIRAKTGGAMPSFGVAEQLGTTTLRNVKLFKGSAQRYVRKFENGLVLLNMTAHDWVVPIDSAGNLTLTSSNGTTVSWNGGKAYTSAIYRRLNGTQCPTETRDGITFNVNNGATIGSTIFVPRNDAVFLRLHSSN